MPRGSTGGNVPPRLVHSARHAPVGPSEQRGAIGGKPQPALITELRRGRNGVPSAEDICRVDRGDPLGPAFAIFVSTPVSMLIWAVTIIVIFWV